MKSIKILTVALLTVVVFNVLSSVCFAYDSQTTHPNFTDITVEAYNAKLKNKILQSEKYWVKLGSMDEDNGARALNHFYDPIYNRTWKMAGLEGLIPKVTSRRWVNDQARQSAYDIMFLASLKVKTSSYIESEANQTYNRAVYEYLKGNKKEAFYALGHVLHLLQDLTSPPHTRADAHSGGKDQSSYEKESEGKTIDDFKILYNKLKGNNIVVRNNIEDYFYETAVYTNNNFYSEDTIVDPEYNKPEIYQKNSVEIVNGEDKYYLLGWDNEIQNVYRLAKKNGRDWKLSDGLNTYNIKDLLVFEDYWSRLSKKAVLEGVGVIDLFFRDIEKKKNDPAFFAVMEQRHGVSFFENLVGDITVATNYLLNLFKNQPEDVIVLPPNNSSTTTMTLKNSSNTTITLRSTTTLKSTTTKSNVSTTKGTTTTKLATTTTKKVTTTTKKMTTTTKKPTTTTTRAASGGGGSSTPQSQCAFISEATELDNGIKKVILNEIAWMGSKNSFNDEWIELKNISNEKVDVSLWEIISKDKSIKIVIPSGTILNPQELYLLERTNDDTILHIRANQIYVGSIRNTNEEIRLMNKECWFMDGTKANPDWPAGDNDQKQSMERHADFSWYTSLGQCINNVCGTPKAENSIKVGGTTTTTSTSTTTSTVPTATTTTTTTIPEDKGEIKNVVISEVMVSGKTADDEFIELYNPSEADIDLTGFGIYKQTGNNNENESAIVTGDTLNGKTIKSHGYFLITPRVKDGEVKYTGLVTSDVFYNSESYFISNNNNIILKDNYDRIVDKIAFGNGENSKCEDDCLQNIEDNKSFERKANENSTMETMVNGVDKLQGNGYDTDISKDNFVIRDTSDPQNSESLLEPREEAGGGGSDGGDGFVLKNFKFHYTTSAKDKIVIEFDVDEYPFWNNQSENDDFWRAMVFYLNSSDGKITSLTRERNNVDGVGYAGWQVSGNTNPVLLLKYSLCEGGLNTRLGASFDSSLILPEGNGFTCTGGEVGDHYGAPNAIAYNYSNNPTHVEVEVIGILGSDYARNYDTKSLFKDGDYITIGFYKGRTDRGGDSLDSTELIFEDNSKYGFSESEFKTIGAPANLVGNYNSENYTYDFSWDKLSDETGVTYQLCLGDSAENVGGTWCHDSDIIKDGDKWTHKVSVENIPTNYSKLYFGVRALNSEYSLVSGYSNVVEDVVHDMPRRIDKYISNVNWHFKNDRLVVELDLDRMGKFTPVGNGDYTNHSIMAFWDFRSDSNIEFYPNPAAIPINGIISNDVCGSGADRRLWMFTYNGLMTKGHKEFLIKTLDHPLLNGNSLYNAGGLTREDMNKLIKSEENPAGIMDNLSQMQLALNYGAKYETVCGAWGSFTSFTPDTNEVPNQIKYSFNDDSVQ